MTTSTQLVIERNLTVLEQLCDGLSEIVTVIGMNTGKVMKVELGSRDRCEILGRGSRQVDQPPWIPNRVSRSLDQTGIM